jgi:hypothetical protein
LDDASAAVAAASTYGYAETLHGRSCHIDFMIIRSLFAMAVFAIATAGEV